MLCCNLYTWQRLCLADALSHAPLPYTEYNIPIEKVDIFAETVMPSLPTYDCHLNEFHLAQAKDTECSQLIEYCHSGWPTIHKIKIKKVLASRR